MADRGGNCGVAVEVVDRLPIPRPFTLSRFACGLSERRGRTIELVPARLGASAPCGLLVSTDDVDYVCYASNTSAIHQLHIVLHEVGHLELGHTSRRIMMGSAAPTSPHASQIEPPGDPLRAFEALLPRLSPALIRRLLGRAGYRDADERDAELYATLAGERINRVIDPSEGLTSRDRRVVGLQTLFDISRVPGDLGA
ncbi:hypothetical protein [Actinophytocola sediminis]